MRATTATSPFVQRDPRRCASVDLRRDARRLESYDIWLKDELSASGSLCWASSSCNNCRCSTRAAIDIQMMTNVSSKVRARYLVPYKSHCNSTTSLFIVTNLDWPGYYLVLYPTSQSASGSEERTCTRQARTVPST